MSARRKPSAAARARRPLKSRGAYQASKDELLHRFNRVSGQLEGIRTMVDEERYCPEVLVQLSAAIAALEKIGFILLRDHIRGCVADGIREGRGDDYMDELMATVQRFTGR